VLRRPGGAVRAWDRLSPHVVPPAHCHTSLGLAENAEADLLRWRCCQQLREPPFQIYAPALIADRRSPVRPVTVNPSLSLATPLVRRDPACAVDLVLMPLSGVFVCVVVCAQRR